MNKPACSFDGCENPRKSRGWCQTHYVQWRSGKPLTPARRRFPDGTPAIEKVMALQVVTESGCYGWSGRINDDGYAKIDAKRGKDAFAHRVMYVHAHGEPEPGLVVNHLCGTNHCTRLDHLEAVTFKENVQYRPRLSRNNTSGYRGVTRTPWGRWVAQVNHNKKIHYLGTYGTPEEAAEVASEFRAKHFLAGEFKDWESQNV